MSFRPWQNHPDHKEAARMRELSLPPQYRMAGNQRYLRDAMLSVMMLSINNQVPGLDLEQMIVQVCARGNMNAKMTVKVNELKKHLTPEQITEAATVAQALFSWELVKTRRAGK